ncbi:transmembrane protein 205-like [Mya arenaria]|uniref:transmembrane protein 205-like n=1 Tax=Mya arenaria TaxID=6604 RepID=UPI0022E34F23|nr:transmembrane protein 205-like [Mya arenaria]
MCIRKNIGVQFEDMYCTCPGKCEQNSLDRERSDSDPCVPMAGNTRLSEQCAFRGGFEVHVPYNYLTYRRGKPGSGLSCNSGPVEDVKDVCTKTCSRFVQYFSAIALATTILYLIAGTGSNETSKLVTFLHILSFAAHFGAQCWVTFIAGITMFFNLPRLMFGRVQCRLFPLYFGTCLGLSCLTFVTYAMRSFHESRTSEETHKMFLLGACIALTFLNSFFLAPGIVNSMIHMFELEKGTNVALAVGFCDRSELKKQPDYVQYYKLFRMYHSVSGVANILTMICNVVYVYHLACLCTF